MKPESILRNVDSIIKWFGYIAFIVFIISIIAMFVVMFTGNQWRIEENIMISLFWAFGSFVTMVSNFALYLITRACKVYLEKNATLVG